MKTYLKSELQQVPVDQRVPGRVYGVSDHLEDNLSVVCIFYDKNTDITGTKWNYWFELPEDMLPVRMPEVGKEYEFDIKRVLIDGTTGVQRGVLAGFAIELIDANSSFVVDNIRPLPTPVVLPELTIPAGTQLERIEYLRKILSEME